jgi:DNA-binding transcriptional regulator YhcF (GntR family)
VIANLIAAQPEKSNRQIAKQAKTSPTTVGTVRTEMEERGEVSKLDTRTDAKGVKQPAKKAKAKREPTAEEAEASYQETVYERACVLWEEMTSETGLRFFAYIEDKVAEMEAAESAVERDVSVERVGEKPTSAAETAMRESYM